MSRRSSSRSEQSAAPAPFRRPIPVRSVSRKRPLPFDIAPEPDEKPAIAEYLGMEALRSLRFRGELVAADEDEWRVMGRLQAEVIQTCVVSLASVRGKIDELVERTYVPEERLILPAEIDMDPDAPDDPDPYGISIDPGLLALETLVLTLDPYPRALGLPPAEIHAGPPGAEPISDADLKPFAKLAVLKGKLDGNR